MTISRVELERLYRHALALTAVREDAEDLLQSCLTEWLSRPKHGVAAPVAYLRQMLRSRFLDARRRSGIVRFEPIDAVDALPDPQQSLERMAIDEDTLAAVWAQLESPEREVLYLWAVEPRKSPCSSASHGEVSSRGCTAHDRRSRIDSRRKPVEADMADQRPLREQLRRKFERERLDDRQYERLRAGLVAPARPARLSFGWAATAAIACALVVAALVGPPRDPAWQVDQIARHVSHYHLQDSPLEIEAESLPTLRAGLDRLDFQPVLPASAENMRLQGGRHCTLLGGVASQLRFIAADGQRVSLYEAAYDPQRFGPLPTLERRQSALEVARNGLRIRIWVEAGIVMAEVRESAPPDERSPLGERNS